jgi:hypothetical protein
MLPEAEINQVLHSEAEPEQACRRLVARANEAGGRDNITAVVAHFQAATQPELPAPSRVAPEERSGPTEPVAAEIPLGVDPDTASQVSPALVVPAGP